MKIVTIFISDDNQEKIASLLKSNGFNEFSIGESISSFQKTENYESIHCPQNPPINLGDFYIPTFDEIKNQNIPYEKISNIGWFRAPDGHLCSADCYSKYFNT